ncbi:unnamed protein product [Phyllotreta striolata]|uniref:Uncharacterized protein n=1 Tax=Phyllotreta striolata TaxID=444603 RepID=A0A9N9TQ95_PHYSR|nr:unnamed protein product [Phyllotreta striolata]
MEKDKSRGIKHIKDKSKYKGNTKKNPKFVPQKQLQPNLGSNWDRYENEEETGEDLGIGIEDFATFADAPISKGKYFQSKSDKLLAKETESFSLNELFTVNLEELEKKLMTVPYYERVDINKAYFLDSQIEYMNREAEENMEKFNKTINLHAQEISPINKELEELVLSSSEEFTAKESKKDVDNSNSTEKNADLEQWLDDFLND